MQSPSLTAPGLTLTEVPRALLLPVTAPTLDAAMLYTALADIAALLHGDPADAAVASGVRHILDARPLPGLRCALGPGSTGEDVARLFGSLLVALPIAFTVILGAITRSRPKIEAAPCGQCGRRCAGHLRPLTAGEAGQLHLPASTCAQGWHRDGTLTAGEAAVDTSVTLLPDLVPAGPMEMIRQGTPVGIALPDLYRADTEVRLRWPADPGLTVSAVICLNGRRAGIVHEEAPAAALDRIAKAATR